MALEQIYDGGTFGNQTEVDGWCEIINLQTVLHVFISVIIQTTKSGFFLWK